MSGQQLSAEQGAVAERRQSAREAGWDEIGGNASRAVSDAIEEAIEVATRVKITQEIIDQFKRLAHPAPLEPNIMPALKAAFGTAGFEVVE